MSDSNFVKFDASTDPASIPSDVRHKLLLIHAALVIGNLQEASHWLYSIACPSFQCYEPYAAIEGRKCACGPHVAFPQDLPTTEFLKKILTTK